MLKLLKTLLLLVLVVLFLPDLIVLTGALLRLLTR